MEDKIKSLAEGGVVWTMDEQGTLSPEAINELESRVPKDEKVEVWIDEAQYLPDYISEKGEMFEIKTAEHMGLQHDHIAQEYLDKPQKRSMKRSRDNAGRLIELHPTKGWRKVRGVK